MPDPIGSAVVGPEVVGLDAVVREAAARFGDAPLYVLPDGSTFSYADLDRRSDAAALGLRAAGVGEGDVVAVLLGSGPAYAVAYAAAAKIGAITAGVNERLARPERRRCLQVAVPSVVLAAPDDPLATDLGVDAPVVLVDDTRPPDDVLAELDARDGGGGGTARLPVDLERPIAIVFTSGTTGAPKGAVFAGRQLEAIAEADGGRRWGAGGRGLSGTSFSHLGYMTKLPQTLRGGGCSVITRKWSAAGALDAVERYRLTTVGGIPTQVALMLRHARFAATDRSSVRLVALGGGPSTASLVRGARTGFGCPVVTRYTCTEAGVGTGTGLDDPLEDAEQTVGRARPGVDVSIRTDDGDPLPVGEIGQVCLRSDAVMSGYWRDPEATAAAMTADGAVRTGDLGFLDEQGRLHLAGRSKEMYVRGGYNVYPQQVETALAEHPGVAHLAVAPRPDPVMGEIGVAVVVPTDPVRPPALQDLRTLGSSSLAAHELPEALVVVDELPRTAMEKIDRRALAALVETLPPDHAP